MARAIKPPGPPVPVEELSPPHRQRVLDTYNDLTRTIELTARKLRERAELVTQPGHVPGIDPAVAKSLLDLARAAKELLGAYPGLLELSDAGDVGGDGAIGGADAAERLRSALGGVGPPDPS